MFATTDIHARQRLLEQASELKRSAQRHAYATATQYLEEWAKHFVKLPADQYAQPLDGVLTEKEVGLLIESFGYQNREQLLARVRRAVNSAWQSKFQDYAGCYPNNLDFGAYGSAIYYFEPTRVSA